MVKVLVTHECSSSGTQIRRPAKIIPSTRDVQVQRAAVRKILCNQNAQELADIDISDIDVEQDAKNTNPRAVGSSMSPNPIRIENNSKNPTIPHNQIHSDRLVGIRNQSVDDEKDHLLQAKESPGDTAEVSSELEERIAARGNSGFPLPDSTRQFLEPRFGYDFSAVRIHADDETDQMNHQLGARAFTLGSNVFFRGGMYQPGSRDGRKLLAHELTHVVQQSQVAGNSSVISQTAQSMLMLDRHHTAHSSYPWLRIEDTGHAGNVHFNRVQEWLRWIEACTTGRSLLSELNSLGERVYINICYRCDGFLARPHNVGVPSNPTPIPGERYRNESMGINLAHELIHVLRQLQGVSLSGNEEEWATMGLGPHAGLPITSNRIRCEQGLALRHGHFDDPRVEVVRWRNMGYTYPRCRGGQYSHPLTSEEPLTSAEKTSPVTQ